MTIQSINPATEETIFSFDAMSAAQVDAIIGRAHAAQADWAAR